MGIVSARILVVDNYDSFVYTIIGYLEQLGAVIDVVRNDAVPLDAITQGQYNGVLVSPGPGTPSEAGATLDVIRECARTATPMLGVCLGHQALGQAFGATVSHAPELMHGKTSEMFVDSPDAALFAGLPQPFTATRYHSLAIEPATVPPELVVTARTENGIIQGISHRELPLHGVQFHPESVLTEGGHRLLANWLAMCGDPDAVERSRGLKPQVHA